MNLYLQRAISQLDEPLQGSMKICNGQGVLTDFNATTTPDWRMRVIYVPQVSLSYLCLFPLLNQL